MQESLARHLDKSALQMGGFLRGFDDPSIHVEATAEFISSFRKVLEFTMLHQEDVRIVPLESGSKNP